MKNTRYVLSQIFLHHRTFINKLIIMLLLLYILYNLLTKQKIKEATELKLNCCVYKTMLKMNKFEELLKCKVCQSTFTNPVLLPCFETVCQKDLIPTDGKLIIDCKFCGDQHVATADKGFPVDKRTQDFVNLFFDQLFHGVLYKNGKNCIEDLDSKFKELEVLEKDPHNYIYEYFLELKTKVRFFQLIL